MHIETLLRYIQACSGIFVTLCNPRIFTNLPYSEPWHIQKLAIGHYSSMFRHIQKLVQPLHMQNPSILQILGYSEPLHNWILMHIQNPVIFMKINEYSEL